MGTEQQVRDHYTHGTLFASIAAAMASAGIDIDSATVADLAQLDHFHGRGLLATKELLDSLDLARDCLVLDVGCGIGGPARYVADRFGCRVTGIDLTEEFCAVARRLNQIVGLDERITIEVGSATDLPFADGTFDAAYSQNVSMNIADKSRFYGEIFRVLKPGGVAAFAEIARGDGGDPVYPVPWSSNGSNSYLQTPDAAKQAIATAGYDLVSWRDHSETVIAANRAQRAQIARDGPPKLGPHILMGAGAREKMRNSAGNIEHGRVRPIDIVCRKPGGG